MPRWMPSVGPGPRRRPTPDVSHHMLLPCRCATVSRRPTSASRIWPGECGPADEGVGVVDVDDAPAQPGPLDDRPRGLDLGQFRHRSSLPSRASPSARRSRRGPLAAMWPDPPPAGAARVDACPPRSTTPTRPSPAGRRWPVRTSAATPAGCRRSWRSRTSRSRASPLHCSPPPTCSICGRAGDRRWRSSAHTWPRPYAASGTSGSAATRPGPGSRPVAVLADGRRLAAHARQLPVAPASPARRARVRRRPRYRRRRDRRPPGSRPGGRPLRRRRGGRAGAPGGRVARRPGRAGGERRTAGRPPGPGPGAGPPAARRTAGCPPAGCASWTSPGSSPARCAPACSGRSAPTSCGWTRPAARTSSPAGPPTPCSASAARSPTWPTRPARGSCTSSSPPPTSWSPATGPVPSTASGTGDGELAGRYPGLVVVRLAAWGHSGPWRGRRGFDSVVQAATGIAAAEGGPHGEPGALPCQLLDHGTGYLAAAAALDGVRRQAEQGGTHLRTLSLARTAHWLLSVRADPAPAIDDDAGGVDGRRRRRQRGGPARKARRRAAALAGAARSLRRVAGDLVAVTADGLSRPRRDRRRPPPGRSTCRCRRTSWR